MRIEGLRLYLRDTRLSDLEQRRHWELIDTEWKAWDAPWEYEGLSKEALVLESERYLERLKRRLERSLGLADTGFRVGFEIVLKQKDRPIGWVNCYEITDRFEWTPGINAMGTAVGLVIPAVSDRAKGYGAEALLAYIDYFRTIGYRELYTQTWSGNRAMVCLAERLGFEVIERRRNSLLVRGARYDGLTYRLVL